MAPPPRAWSRAGARLDLHPAVEECEPLAHPEESDAALANDAWIESVAVVLDHRRHGGVSARDGDADPAGARVLDDVRQRLLHNAVESGLDLARQPLLTERGVEVDADARLLGERLRQPLECGDEAEVVEHGRPKLDCKAAHILQSRDDMLAQLGQGGTRRMVG